MVRHSPRNQRSKGFKVKHALQIGLLLAVCIWLLYQVKHSHDKKKVFEETHEKISENVQNVNEILRLGRKDLNPRVKEAAKESERQRQEDTEAEEESKPEETGDEGKEGKDNEINEHDQEKAENEAEHREDLIDEKEREEESEVRKSEEEGAIKDTGSMDDQTSEEIQIKDRDPVDDQGHDAGDMNTQEAREENYRGDDASSAVIRDTRITNSETEIRNPEEEEQGKDAERNESQQESRTNSTEESSVGQNTSNPEGEGEKTEVTLSVNSTANEENINGSTLTGLEGSSPDSAIIKESTDRLDNNSVVMGDETLVPSMQNGTNKNFHSSQDQNETTETRNSNEHDSNLQVVPPEETENSSSNVEHKQSDFNATLSVATENEDAAKTESNESTRNSESVPQEEQTTKPEAVAVLEDSSASSNMNESTDAVETEKSNTNTETKGTNESQASSVTNENAETVQSEPLDSSVSSIPQEEKDARTDLETLPETKTGGINEDAAAE